MVGNSIGFFLLFLRSSCWVSLLASPLAGEFLLLVASFLSVSSLSDVGFGVLGFLVFLTCSTWKPFTNSLEGSPGLLVPREMADASDLESTSASRPGAGLGVATWVGGSRLFSGVLGSREGANGSDLGSSSTSLPGADPWVATWVGGSRVSRVSFESTLGSVSSFLSISWREIDDPGHRSWAPWASGVVLRWFSTTWFSRSCGFAKATLQILQGRDIPSFSRSRTSRPWAHWVLGLAPPGCRKFGLGACLRVWCRIPRS